MPITVSTVAPTLRLTTRTAVKNELGGTFVAADDALLDVLIDQASSAIAAFTHRVFARETLTEALGSYGDIRLQLARTPIVAVTAVSIYSSVVTDYGIEDADKGWLFVRSMAGTASQSWMRQPFPWSAQSYGGLSAGGAFLDQGTPLPRQEEPACSVSYTGGYILPAQFLAPLTVSVSAVDNSFNDSASGFPALLKAGDILEASGFVNGANNARHLVAGTPTTSKIVVTTTLTTEAAPGAATSIKFRPPSAHRPFDDVEKAAIEAVKSWWLARTTDSNVIEKQAGPMRLRFSENKGTAPGLPATCVGLLRAWVRAA